MLRYIIINLLGTMFRFLPLPTKPGLVKIGHPDRNSPVLLTCNYQLTVERVKRALKGLDCYLLIANSRGINVWCGATGGHLTHYGVISILKLSGIERLVDHRTVIMPQLAATAIEPRVIEERTGWRIRWGPVYAHYLPAYLERGQRKGRQMRTVTFDLRQRLEMAVMWAFPISLLAICLTLFLWPAGVLPLVGLIWGLSILIFISFPLYDRWFNRRKRSLGLSRYTVFFDLSLPTLILWISLMVGLSLYGLVLGGLSGDQMVRWGLSSLVILLFLNLDLMGSSPLYKSGLHEDRRSRIVRDPTRCKDDGICLEVCPRGCYEVDEERAGLVRLQYPDRCVQCGACIVQCPWDALSFETPAGGLIRPETIRRYKLNLLGRRVVDRVG